MAINRILDREEFTAYCLRKLGEPVIQVNVSPEQVEDAVDDALDMFWEYHADGSTQGFFKHEIDQDDLDNGYFGVDKNTLSIIRVLSLSGGGGSNGIAMVDNLQMFSYFSDLVSKIPNGGMGGYYTSLGQMNMMTETFNAEKLIAYNKHQDRLTIKSDPSLVRLGEYIVYEAVVVNDPEENPETWNNWWLKNYTVAVIKKQWGVNLGKYQGVTLPSGITLNGEAIRSEASAEIEALEQRLRDEFQLPLDMFTG